MPKISKIKSVILETINSNLNSVSHLDVMKLTEFQYDRVSIYRVLDKLSDENLIHKFIDLEGVHRYASQKIYKNDNQKLNLIENQLHAHFNCKLCNNITCIDISIDSLIISKGYNVDKYNLMIEGSCQSCLNKL